jgi:DNA polymerase-3 subunit epsilon
MRQVVLDTETTGLEVSKGHRVIEIGCVEMLNRRRTNRTYHRYLQPDREIDPAAEEVHGITRQRLADEPRFPDIADEFIEFVSGAELIIHNADFDVGFLNSELKQAAKKITKIADCCVVVDTLALARRIHPGQRNNLDALCKRYFVDNTGRDFHGALLDAQLLADVYLAMTGGQGSLSLDAEIARGAEGPGNHRHVERSGVKLKVVRATAADLEIHQQQLDLIDEASDEGAIWRKIDA